MNPISLNQDYRTRDGREVHLLAVADAVGLPSPDAAEGYPVSGMVRNTDAWCFVSWTPEGRYVGPAVDSPLDLIEEAPLTQGVDDTRAKVTFMCFGLILAFVAAAVAHGLGVL